MNAQTPNPDLRSIPEALKVLPVSREAFYRKLKSGALPSYRFGAKVLVDLHEVLAAMRIQAQRQLDR